MAKSERFLQTREASLLRLPTVQDRTGLSCSTIYAKMDRGEFPKPVKLTDRSVAWLASEIDQWVADVVAAQRAAS